MSFLNRPADHQHLEGLLKRFPVVAILGPRQSGKTTLAKTLRAQHYFDFEKPSDLESLKNPELVLGPLKGLIVLDEVQRRPELFPVLRYLVDSGPKARRFLILGSASPVLLKQTSESLTGRIAYLELEGFRSTDVPQKLRRHCWLRGGMPKSLLARSDVQSYEWRETYIRTYLEQDIPQFGIRVGAATLRRFWSMLAHYHGGILNLAELGSNFGMSEVAIRNYLEILENTFMIRLLHPWHENLSKRQIKRPKIYFRDSGLLHSFLGISKQQDLLGHPKLGASWEGWILSELIRNLRRAGREFYFWGTHGGAELDLLMIQEQKRIGFEFKFSDAPKMTESMKSALSSLHLDFLYVIYPGDKTYLLDKKIQVLPLKNILLARHLGRVISI